MPPGHFYSPIPDLDDIRSRAEDVFGTAPPTLPAIDLNDAAQLELLGRFAVYSRDLPFPRTRTAGFRYFFENPHYSFGDAISLYCMIRHLRPARIVEVGSGYSSCVTLDTNARFFDGAIAVTMIEPYPDLLHSLVGPGDLSRCTLLDTTLQNAPREVFSALQANDILFIDSTHVSKTGSDVNRLIFEILPALRSGVYVHFHDVFYPFEYPREWVYEGRAWNENYILRAFLAYNAAFEIVFFMSYLLQRHQEALRSALPLALENPGGNLWLRKT